MKDRILNYLHMAPSSRATQVAATLRESPKVVGAHLSALHKEGTLTAESIWITVRPCVKQPVLHYSVKVTK